MGGEGHVHDIHGDGRQGRGPGVHQGQVPAVRQPGLPEALPLLDDEQGVGRVREVRALRPHDRPGEGREEMRCHTRTSTRAG